MNDVSEAGGTGAQAAHPLQRCAEIFDALEEALLAEQQALLDRDPEVLLTVAERKRRLLVELDRSAAGLAELPRAAPQLRSRIEAAFERCRQLNQINGGVVAATRGATEKALALLRGDRYHAPTYDRLGDSHPSAGPRTLAQA